MDKKVLVVDDDQLFVKMVSKVLTEEFEVLTASDGREAMRLIFSNKPDLVLLDVMMPGMDGWDTCMRIRDVSDVPIIIISGKEKTENSIVQGLDYGADDYLIKPIGNRELLARVRAILRRTDHLPSADIEKGLVYSDNYLSIDLKEHKVTVNGSRVKLTPREFRLLAHLVENAGRVISHRQLLEKVWGWEYIDDIDYIRIYISHLRKKIEPNYVQPEYILTEPGFGYRFTSTNEAL